MLTIRLASETREVITETQIVVLLLTIALFGDKADRTIDQMILAARSGKQNIAEGSAASSTWRETELKLNDL